jgi:hypothetical protein
VAAELSIFDIAHSAAQTCRWTGHTRMHYPLAQHQVLASELVWKVAYAKGYEMGVVRRTALWALLHDGSESYIADIARPVKVKMPQYYEIETPIMGVICEHWQLPREMPQLVKWADDVLLCTEARDLLRPPSKAWIVGKNMPTERLGRIRPWPMWYAEYRFLKRYTELTGEPTMKQFVKNKVDDVLSLFRPSTFDPAFEAAKAAR